MSNPRNKCTTGDHRAIKADRARFDELELIGFQPDEEDDGTPFRLELRNCACGSTLALKVSS